MEGKDKTKVLFVGDGVAPTGFSTVLHGIIGNLPKDEYDIHHMAVNYYGDPHEYSHKIYPAANPSTASRGDIIGVVRLPELLNKIEPDLVFILNDIWVVTKYLQTIKDFYSKTEKQQPKVVVYFPVDGDGYSPEWFEHFDVVTEVAVYTEFAKNVVQKAVRGINPHVIPHGIDRGIFYKTHETRKEAKIALKETVSAFPENSFIVLNANRNQPRKRIDVALEGFAKFAKGKPSNVMYYHHAGTKDVGWDVLRLVQLLSQEHGYDLSSRVILTSTESSIQRVTREHLNMIYNACDVGLTTSTGEGWGLTAMEHAVTGAPQVTGNHTACAELFKDCGVLVDPTFVGRDGTTLLQRHYVSPNDVATALELLYEDKELYKDLSQKSVDKFSDGMYDWKVIAGSWDSLFQSIL